MSKGDVVNGKRRRTVQDDSREKQLAVLCGLQYVETREGPDAVDRDGNLYELKSTTRSGVSTARDVGPHTIREWRTKYWIFAVGEYYESGLEIESLYVAHPHVLEDRFSEIERQILSKYDPCMKVLDAARRAGVSPEILRIAEAVIDRGGRSITPKSLSGSYNNALTA